MFLVYWRQGQETHEGYVKARTPDEAYDFANKKLDKDCYVIGVYRVSDGSVEPESFCMNFKNLYM